MSVLKKDLSRIDGELWNATHTNSNRLVGLAIKTTGPDPRIHEIAQICIFPLTSKFDLAKETVPFYCDIRPLKPRIDLELRKGLLTPDKYEEIRGNADTPQSVAKLYDSWIENKIKLAFGKKLLPLTYNWAAARPFIKKWLGSINFNATFSEEYRDLMSLALFCNDYADMHIYQLPYAKVKMRFLATILKIEYDKFDDTILHVKTYTEIYKEMMRRILPSFQPLIPE